MDEQEELTPEQSKCWSCKYGMALGDTDLQSFFQPSKIAGDPFDDDKPEQEGMSEVTFPIKKIRSACYWRPAGMTGTLISPVIFNVVTECSKYAAEN